MQRVMKRKRVSGERERAVAEGGARIVNRVAFEEWLFGEHKAAGAIALARPRRDDG
jgi:hypothetical protein